MGKLQLEPKGPGAEGSNALAQGFFSQELDGFSLPGSLGGKYHMGSDILTGPAAQRGARNLGQQSRTGPAGAAHNPSVVRVSVKKRAEVSLLTARCHPVLHLAPETLTGDPLAWGGHMVGCVIVELGHSFDCAIPLLKSS